MRLVGEASYDILGDWISSVPLLASGIHGLWNIIIADEVNANSNFQGKKVIMGVFQARFMSISYDTNRADYVVENEETVFNTNQNFIFTLKLEL